ncbi:MAG: tRNA (adenosine(37)-N6)-dimethylallyltransferase MiaA [Phycisphaerales bacterium]|nr:tRNA (adenosine(37)-N6)-dimethylallyltransferase MiaA [Phycisphaerales bacterium]
MTTLDTTSPHLIPIIAGPTAGGKTAIAVELALRVPTGGEILSADSMQVYRHMDIGTAKPTPAETRGVPHHLIGIVDPVQVAGGQSFTVDDWLPLAESAVREIQQRGGVAIIAGGTNLYIRAFLEGLFDGPAPDAALRQHLSDQPLSDLRARLEAVDPEAAARIHRNDRRRTVRAIEVYELTGRPISAQQKQWDQGKVRHGCRLVILDWPVEQINRRINARVKQMMQAGLLDEVRRLRDMGAMAGQPREALGYKQLMDHLDGPVTLDEAVERIKIETRRFAKNQRTWLRRLSRTPGAVTLHPAEVEDDVAAVLAERIASEIWLDA